MNTEATISHLAADGMPAAFADAEWTTHEGMDYPFSNLADLLDDLEPVKAEWLDGDTGLLLTWNDRDGEKATEGFQPVSTVTRPAGPASLDDWNERMTAEQHTQTLRRYGTKQRELTYKRDVAIRAAHADGMSLRAIAEAVGLSHTGVQRIVRQSG